MEKLEGFFQSFDMFSAPATLRAKGSSSVTRTSAGVISFILFCYFAYIFIFGMYKIFTYESITSSQTFQVHLKVVRKFPLPKYMRKTLCLELETSDSMGSYSGHFQ